MEQKPYDLSALMWEIQQAAKDGAATGQDLARVIGLVLDRLDCATAAEAYDRLYADWRALPPGTVLSGMRAGQILNILPMLRFDQPLDHPEWEEELRRAAEEHGPSDRSWQANVKVIGSFSGIQQLSDPAEMEAALVRLDEARAALAPGSPSRDALDLSHASLRAHLAQIGGGEDDFDSAVEDMARLVDSPAFDDVTRLTLRGQVAVFRVHPAIRREDEAALEEQIHAIEDVLARLPRDQMDLLTFESHLEGARSALASVRARRTGGELAPLTERPSFVTPLEEARRQIAALPRNAQADKLGETGWSWCARGLLHRDQRTLVEGMGLFEDALDLIEPDDERWIRYVGVLGLGHCSLAILGLAPGPERRHHLDQGIAWLRHALRMSGGPEHSRWGIAGSALAHAYRFRGDLNHLVDPRAKRLNHEASRRLGLETLRAAAWNVMLQSGTAHAAETARRAGEEAVDVARWCLADGAHADAVRALDAGRGLALHAATVATTVPDMLTALGHSDLADEWRRAGTVRPDPGPEATLLGGASLPATGPSSRLRRRVLHALAASPLRQRLLDAPSPEEIGAALRTMGATALIYLVPGEEESPSLRDTVLFGMRRSEGAALVVSADGTTRAVELPDLRVDAPELAAYRATGTPGRDAGGPPTEPAAAPPPDAAVSRAALERLCDWAGRAAMEPLLKHLPRGYGRVPSVVLVPMAELGAVPWHAARLPGRRGGRVCEQADISYLPSARLLCDVAARPAARTRQALVVGNPTRDLHHAGEEAEAVHRVFHPHGDLLGPGTATPAAVTDWLRRQQGGLLHLACHGVVRQGERHSAYLALSGGQLAAEELTEGVTRYRGLELVVLAACRTNVSGRGYDEAYSLSTAFLVAGARSVIGSLWPVPDEATSLLMYMTHHFMSRDGLPPGSALRSAQLWMLNDRREPPPGMPAHLQARVRHIRSDDLTAWAGFTHLGW